MNLNHPNFNIAPYGKNQKNELLELTKCYGTKSLPHNSISLTFWTIFFTENIRYPFNIFPVIGIWGTKPWLPTETHLWDFIKTYLVSSQYRLALWNILLSCRQSLWTDKIGPTRDHVHTWYYLHRTWKGSGYVQGVGREVGLCSLLWRSSPNITRNRYSRGLAIQENMFQNNLTTSIIMQPWQVDRPTDKCWLYDILMYPNISGKIMSMLYFIEAASAPGLYVALSYRLISPRIKWYHFRVKRWYHIFVILNRRRLKPPSPTSHRERNMFVEI